MAVGKTISVSGVRIVLPRPIPTPEGRIVEVWAVQDQGGTGDVAGGDVLIQATIPLTIRNGRYLVTIEAFTVRTTLTAAHPCTLMIEPPLGVQTSSLPLRVTVNRTDTVNTFAAHYWPHGRLVFPMFATRDSESNTLFRLSGYLANSNGSAYGITAYGYIMQPLGGLG